MTDRFALPDDLFYAVTELRVRRPQALQEAYAQRRRRDRLAPDGKLVILAADHPGRFVTRVGDEPLAMADRRRYLGRILRVLREPGIDGLMGTPDVLDDVVLMAYLLRQQGVPDLLEGRLLVGCINRGGLAGSAWELDDFLTAYTPQRLRELGLDGAKMMVRLNLEDRDVALTLRGCSQWMAELARLELPAFLEPLPVTRSGGGWQVVREAGALARAVGVAQALGQSTAHTWLKLPYAPDFAAVCRSTTLPILILGGESHGDPQRSVDELKAAMAAGANVRGALIGRNVIFPGDADPQAVAAAVVAAIRG